MVIKKAGSKVSGRRAPAFVRVRAAWAAIAVNCLAGAGALGQSIGDQNPQATPIEDTWRYLVEMFRLLLGL